MNQVKDRLGSSTMVRDKIHSLGSRNVFGDRLGGRLTGLCGNHPWLS